MLKTVVAGATVLILAVGASAYAQQPPGGPDFGRRQFTPEDRTAFLNARIAALHAGLQLTPEQETAWPAFEQAYRDLAATRGGGAFRPRAEQLPDPVGRAQREADALAARGAALKRYADAMAPLYQGLDDSQKRRFRFLSRMERLERPPFHRFAFGRDGERGEFRSPRGEFRP